MRSVVCPGLGREVSALGFGCAPLGSRISETQGLRALGLAFERGVSWYDVAPSFGDGEAEGILGKFLAGRRDRVAICTKFGIPRPVISSAMRFIRPAARAMARALPLLRGGMAKARGTRSRERLRAEQIESSVVESLRRLRTDYIDVLALHEPWPQECESDTILRELRRMIERGYVRCVAIAGESAAIVAGTRAADLYKIVQLRDDPFVRTAEGVKGALASYPSLFFVTCSLFGIHERLSRLLVGDGGRLGALASQLGYGPPFMASEMILDHAFAANPEGVVLASMFTPAHIEMNCARAARPPRKDIGPFMQKFVAVANR
jgi:aryl-alcohol dehydrogenase-like predicted oxidoreductase